MKHNLNFYFLALVLVVLVQMPAKSADKISAKEACAILSGVATSRMSVTSGVVVYEVAFFNVQAPGQSVKRDACKLSIEFEGDQFRSVKVASDSTGIAEVEVVSRNNDNILLNYNSGGKSAAIKQLDVPVFGFDPRLLGVVAGPYAEYLADEQLFQYCEEKMIASAIQENQADGMRVARIVVEEPPGWNVEYTVALEPDFWVLNVTFPQGGYRYINEYSEEFAPLPSSTVWERKGQEGTYDKRSEFRISSFDRDVNIDRNAFQIAGLMLGVGDEFIDKVKSERLGYWDGQALVDSKSQAFRNAQMRGELDSVAKGSVLWWRIGFSLASISFWVLVFLVWRSRARTANL